MYLEGAKQGEKKYVCFEKTFEIRKRGGLVQRPLVPEFGRSGGKRRRKIKEGQGLNPESLPTLISMRSAKHPLYKQEQC